VVLSHENKNTLVNQKLSSNALALADSSKVLLKMQMVYNGGESNGPQRR